MYLMKLLAYLLLNWMYRLCVLVVLMTANEATESILFYSKILT